MNAETRPLQCRIGLHDWKHEGPSNWVWYLVMHETHHTAMHAFTCARCPAVRIRHEPLPKPGAAREAAREEKVA